MKTTQTEDGATLNLMMTMNNFIVFQNYRGFKHYENILMSLIVGLHNSKKTICFSNGYAAFRCGVSVSTITRTISKFVEEGYISCYFKPEGRIIHFLKLPILVDYQESCDISDDTTPPNHHDYTPNHPDYTPSSQELHPLITTTTNNIDYNIEDNIEHNIEHNIEQIENKLVDYKKKYEELVNNFILEGFSNEEAKQYAKDALVFI